MDNTISAAHAQSLLRNYCVHQIQHELEQTSMGSPEVVLIKTLYLGNLCAQGNVEGVKGFLRETEPEELEEILNNRPYEQRFGNCLHMVGYWNTGKTAFELFKLLIDHGAEINQNYYEELPWEQKGGLWHCPITEKSLGRRSTNEFTSTMRRLRQLYDVCGAGETPDTSPDSVSP